MKWVWPFVVLLSFCALLLSAQDTTLLPSEAQPATGTQSVEDAPQQPSAERFAATSRSPQRAPSPELLEFSQSNLQPRAGEQVLIDGAWVSPQLVLGRLDSLPQARLPEVQERRLAPNSFQTASSRKPEMASGLDKKFEGELVKQYANAPVVRFLAPRESLQNLFEQVGLDDLNRYQFRRNRSDSVPVERLGD